MLAALGSLLLAVLIVGAFVAVRGESRAPTVAPDRSLSGTSDAAVARAPVIDARPITADGAVGLAPVIAVVPVDAPAPRSPVVDAVVPVDVGVLAPRPPPPPPPPPVPLAGQAPGELVVLVTPWATLWLDGKPVGETPYRAAISIGRHSLRLVNEERGKNESATVTITTGRTMTIKRNW